jgi:GNAT superfamily N-acetyltransferase
VITLAPYEIAHRDALLAVAVRDDQVVFSGQPHEVIDLNLPQLDMHVILENGTPVGMFRIDRAYHTHHIFAEEVSVGLRTFLIDQNAQGRGIAKAVCTQLRGYLRPLYPAKASVFLTVNLRNPAAKAVYVHGGFKDTGAQLMKGLAGPQNILKLTLV